MRRQRYSHTVCSQEENLQQDDNREEEQLTYDGLYYPPQQPTLPIQHEPSFWPHYTNFDLQSGSRLFPIEPQQRSYSSLSSSFYSVNNYNMGQQYQDAYANHSLGHPILNIEFYSGATGDSPDLNSFYNNGAGGPQYAGNDYEEQYSQRCYSPHYLQPHHSATSYPALSSSGTVFLILRHCIRVDMSAEKAVFVSNYPASCIGVINETGDHSCIVHPNGRILQESTIVHMETGNKKAKFCRRGVVFTSTDHSLAYLVDPSGTKSTSDKFKDLSQNYALEVFLNHNLTRQFEQQSLARCYDLISEASYRYYSNGDEVWLIGGVRIKQNTWGEVRISSNSNRRVLRTSPTINSMSIATAYVFMKISCHPFRHFVVRRGDKTVCAGSTGMAVQNGSQKAGFDRVGRLVLF